VFVCPFSDATAKVSELTMGVSEAKQREIDLRQKFKDVYMQEKQRANDAEEKAEGSGAFLHLHNISLFGATHEATLQLSTQIAGQAHDAGRCEVLIEYYLCPKTMVAVFPERRDNNDMWKMRCGVYDAVWLNPLCCQLQIKSILKKVLTYLLHYFSLELQEELSSLQQSDSTRNEAEAKLKSEVEGLQQQLSTLTHTTAEKVKVRCCVLLLVGFHASVVSNCYICVDVNLDFHSPTVINARHAFSRTSKPQQLGEEKF